MDVAYDHIQEESFPDDERPKKEEEGKEKPKQNDFNTEVQEAYKAISNSPWAARIGGLWGTVKKQASNACPLTNHVLTVVLNRERHITKLRASNRHPW